MSYHWTRQQIIERLTLLNASFARRGKPCPVAARVVERMLMEEQS